MTQRVDVYGIRARHESARINPSENPAWFHTHKDLGWLIEDYDRVLAALDSERAAKELAIKAAVDRDELQAENEGLRSAGTVVLEECNRLQEQVARLTKQLEEARKALRFPRGKDGDIDIVYLRQIVHKVIDIRGSDLDYGDVDAVLLALEQLSNEGEAG